MSHGWRSRGYLPHCDERGLVQHVVFGLEDAFPFVPKDITEPAARAQWADHAFDRGRGSCLLRRPEYALIVQESLFHGDGERYALVAWCVMPTHVHAVIEQQPCFTLARITHSWKSFTAHEINKREGRRGVLWRREYFDRFMRSPEQFGWTVDYVEKNPVAAGLSRTSAEWPFSSAHWRQ